MAQKTRPLCPWAAPRSKVVPQAPQAAEQGDDEERHSRQEKNREDDLDDVIAGGAWLAFLASALRVVPRVAPHEKARDDQTKAKQERERG